MKKTHIVLLIIIAVSIGAFVVTLSDSSTYADFEQAFANPDEEYHVVGKLNKNKAFSYLPEINANQFEFYMIDNAGLEKKVVLQKAKPQDFEKSEQIVLIGNAVGQDFVAHDILMKCPSKYNETQNL